MATPKPGEIRCPTCHRSTPPAAFCTQCGSAIPSDARIRPRGMDRDELQDRIRQRRSGGDPYLRGAVADDGPAGYERFAPEADDSHARRARRTDDRRQDHLAERGASSLVPVPAPSSAQAPEPDEEGAESIVPPLPARSDITREADDWSSRPSAAPPPTPVEAAWAARSPGEPELERVDNYDDDAYPEAEYAYDGDEWEDRRGRPSSGAGAFAILGFLALGVLALLGGAVLAGVFSSDPSTGAASPALTPSPTLQPSSAATNSVVPTSRASAVPTSSAAASGVPVTFPDGFTAQTQPCLPGSAGLTGCASNGVRNGGVLDIWVGFQKGTAADALAVIISDPDGAVVNDGSIPLASINCRQSCNGWTYFSFRNLEAGTYGVRVERNGQLAAETEFTVE